MEVTLSKLMKIQWRCIWNGGYILWSKSHIYTIKNYVDKYSAYMMNDEMCQLSVQQSVFSSAPEQIAGFSVEQQMKYVFWLAFRGNMNKKNKYVSSSLSARITFSARGSHHDRYVGSKWKNSRIHSFHLTAHSWMACIMVHYFCLLVWILVGCFVYLLFTKYTDLDFVS